MKKFVLAFALVVGTSVSATAQTEGAGLGGLGVGGGLGGLAGLGVTLITIVTLVTIDQAAATTPKS